MSIVGFASPTDLLPMGNPQIVSVAFRNKQSGWRAYSMEILVKENTKA